MLRSWPTTCRILDDKQTFFDTTVLSVIIRDLSIIVASGGEYDIHREYNYMGLSQVREP